jgi:hypothetical protein
MVLARMDHCAGAINRRRRGDAGHMKCHLAGMNAHLTLRGHVVPPEPAMPPQPAPSVPPGVPPTGDPVAPPIAPTPPEPPPPMPG